MELIFQEQENQLPKGNRKVNTSQIHFTLGSKQFEIYTYWFPRQGEAKGRGMYL